MSSIVVNCKKNEYILKVKKGTDPSDWKRTNLYEDHIFSIDTSNSIVTMLSIRSDDWISSRTKWAKWHYKQKWLEQKKRNYIDKNIRKIIMKISKFPFILSK